MDIRKRVLKNASMLFVLAVIMILIALTVYSGVWPPASVVESESMEHSTTWQYGTIVPGTIVFVKKTDSPYKDVITYVRGREIGYSTYGEYGNVILYRSPDGQTIIHRAMFFLYWENGTPEIKDYEGQKWIKINEDYIIIYDCGYNGRNLFVNITGMKNESGFITVGDHNLATSPFFVKKYDAYIAADQNIFGYPPVSNSSIVGIAFWNIPWFGLIKLNIMRLYGAWPYYNEVPAHSYEYLIISIIIIFGVPASVNYVYKKRKKD